MDRVEARIGPDHRSESPCLDVVGPGLEPRPDQELERGNQRCRRRAHRGGYQDRGGNRCGRRTTSRDGSRSHRRSFRRDLHRPTRVACTDQRHGTRQQHHGSNSGAQAGQLYFRTTTGWVSKRPSCLMRSRMSPPVVAGSRTVLNNDDCSGLPPASPGILRAVDRPPVDCSAPS